MKVHLIKISPILLARIEALSDINFCQMNTNLFSHLSIKQETILMILPKSLPVVSALPKNSIWPTAEALPRTWPRAEALPRIWPS